MVDTVVILAAGRGSRLGEVTHHRSKAMCPIVGQPMLSRVITTFRDAGLSRFVVVGAPYDNGLSEYCARLGGVTLVYQDHPQGSAKALETCAELVSGRFYVTACDSLVSARNIIQLALDVDRTTAVGGLGIMEVLPTESLEARSVVSMVGDRIRCIIEKPSVEERISNITSIPLYLLSDEMFGVLEKLAPSSRGEYELPQALNILISAGRHFVGTMIDERQELTNREDLLHLSEHYLAKTPQAIEIDPSARIDGSAVIEAPVFIGPHCNIAAGVRVGPYVSMESESRISAGCVVEHSVLLPKSVVTEDARREVIT